MINKGDKFFAYFAGRGYVGYGEVLESAVPIKDFIVAHEGKRLLDLPLKANAGDNSENPELSDWAVAVNWIKTYPKEQAKTFSGIFAGRNVVCKLRDQGTLDFLTEEFEVEN